MSFAATFGDLVVFLTKHDCMDVIRKLASDPAVVSGLRGKEEREAINAARRIVRECKLESATWLILNESNVEGELATEKNKRKFDDTLEEHPRIDVRLSDGNLPKVCRAGARRSGPPRGVICDPGARKERSSKPFE